MKQAELFGPSERRREPARPLKSAELITDGSCIGNPGPGGWAFILRYRDQKQEFWGSEPRSTNNRMELTAVIRGLRAFREPCQVIVFTDSEYVKNGITSWIHRWKQKGWKTTAGTPVVNKDLWTDLDGEADRHEIVWKWVKGHAGHPDNNRCDELATQAARDQSEGQNP